MQLPFKISSYRLRPLLLSLGGLGGILVWFAFFLTNGIDRPWVNQIDFNGAVWSQAAHNILRAGLIETQGASTAFYFGPLPIPHTGYYLHHPPLLHLGVVAMFSLFGEHEWAARVIPIACTLGSAVLLWLLVASCLDRRAATLCTAVFACLPMTLCYGAMVNFEPVVLLLILGVLLALRYWELSRRPLWKMVFLAGMFVGMWVDWAMHLFALVLFVWWIGRGNREWRRLAWMVLALTILSGALYMLRIRVLRPDALQDLENTFWVRVLSNDKYRFTLWQWAAKVGGSIVVHYFKFWLLAAAAGAVIIFQRRNQEGFRWIGWAASVVFAMDALFVGVFQNDSYIHEYIAFYFIFPVAVMAGIALNEITLGIENTAKEWCPGAGNWAALVLIIAGAMAGQAQTKALQTRFCILDIQKQESEILIPALGEVIKKHFPPHVKVLCNFMPYYGPHLEYYAKRQVASNLCHPKYWKYEIQRSKGEVGGIVWMGDERADEIIANLPPGQKEYLRLENENFCVWKPSSNTLARGLN